MVWRTRIAAGLALLLAAAAPAAVAADLVVTMADLAADPTAFVGKRVVLSNCFMISGNLQTGAQCSVDPIDAATLVYIDSDTLACATSALSTSAVPSRWPATLITSSTRPVIQ